MFIITRDVVIIKDAVAPNLSGEVFNRGGGGGHQHQP